MDFGVWILKKFLKGTLGINMSAEFKEEYTVRGRDVMLGLKTKKSAQKAGFGYAECRHKLETNLKVRAEMECLGEKICKQLRIYKKNI